MSPVKIFQIYYHQDQKKLLDPKFIPYDNSQASPPHNFEYSILINQANRFPEQLVGFLSWKFKLKTTFSGKRLLSQINSNPGYDLYFVNPYPHLAVFKTVWEQGEIAHPGITQRAQMLLDASGLNVDLGKLKSDQLFCCYCHFAIGTNHFWDEYIAFISRLYQTFENLSEENKKPYLENAGQNYSHPYLPYIFERMLPTFLALNHDRFNIYQLKYGLHILRKGSLTESLFNLMFEMFSSSQWKIKILEIYRRSPFSLVK